MINKTTVEMAISFSGVSIRKNNLRVKRVKSHRRCVETVT